MAVESSIMTDAASTEGRRESFARQQLGLRRVGTGGASEFENCNQRMSRICGPFRVESERWWAFRGTVHNFNVAALNVTDLRLSDGKVIRDNRGDERYRGDYYSLVLQLQGVARMCQRGTEVLLRPGDGTLIDSRFASIFDLGNGIHQYSFNFRPDVIHRCIGADSSLICRRISGASGAGAVLSDTLRSIVRNAEALSGADLSETAIQLLRAALGRSGSAADRMEVERLKVSARDIANYVNAHIHDTTLKPRDIATHFNLSLRQLYRIAARANCTPSSLIWQRRLHRAHELLASSPHLPITEIAFSCGFKDGAHFSHAYRKAFGQTPRAARRVCSQEPRGLSANAARPIDGGDQVVGALEER